MPFGKPGSVISVNDQIIQNDTLKMIRDQVKEELKEELKNQIRQELIDQLPKESKEALASKGDPSASKEEHLPMSHGGHKGNLGQPMTPS